MIKLNIDIEKLKQQTKDGLLARQVEAEIAERRAKEKEARNRLLQELKAERILSQLSSRCEAESTAGRNFAIVMSVSHSDCRPPNNLYGTCKPEWLQGVPKLVYNACVEANLNPTIEYWHDGIGIESGFNIVVHW